MPLGWNNPADPQSPAYGAREEAAHDALAEAIEGIPTYLRGNLDEAVTNAIGDAMHDARLEEGWSDASYSLQLAAWQEVAKRAADELAKLQPKRAA